MKKKVVLFDFCGTLVDKQTADDFFCSLLKYKRKRLKALAGAVLRIGVVQSFVSRLTKNPSACKELIMGFSKGFKREEIEAFSKIYSGNLAARHLIPVVQAAMASHLENKDEVYIISAGCECYIKYIYPANVKIIANKLYYSDDNTFTGVLAARDCIGERKVEMLKEVLDENRSDYFITAYTDSISDLPLLCYSDRRVIVSKGMPQAWGVAVGAEHLLYD
jgi:HAD superfamily phosphoserine phosphatase-like hydrolase